MVQRGKAAVFLLLAGFLGGFCLPKGLANPRGMHFGGAQFRDAPEALRLADRSAGPATDPSGPSRGPA